MSTQWTSSYSRSKSPSVAESTTAATASRSDTHDVTDLRLGQYICLKEAKREILRDMHVKELIQSNHSER